MFHHEVPEAHVSPLSLRPHRSIDNHGLSTQYRSGGEQVRVAKKPARHNGRSICVGRIDLDALRR